MKMTLTTKRISAEETRYIRHQVLWSHIENTEDCVIDIDHRDDAIHLGAFENGELLAVCSLFRMKTSKLNYEQQYRLRAMGSLEKARGKGAGKAIIQEALQQTKERGVDVLWCDAREVALGFYEKLGFQRIDEWYEVPKVGRHQLMYFPL